jgi:hypothetical protein
VQSYQSNPSNKSAETVERTQQTAPSTSSTAQLHRALSTPNESLTPSHILQMQKTIGNRAVSQLMSARMQTAQAPIQKQANKTGMPDQLKSGLEGSSGFDLSDVRVHYNSSKPAQLAAHAYAQGNDIHIGPGQEKHLPHEGWHVIQQKQGRVKPTMQAETGAFVNDDVGLEREADVMGSQAMRHKGE